MALHRSAALLVTLLVVLAGCASDQEPDPVATPSVAASEEASEEEPSEEPSPEPESPSPSPDAAAADGDEVQVDYISYGAGAFPIREDPDLDQAAVLRSILDGLPGFVAIAGEPTGPAEPISVVIELAAPTSFDTFGIPPMSSFGCCIGTHIATVTVEGSATSPDDGYEQLATFEVAPDVFDGPQLFDATSTAEVRWLRVTLEGRQDPDAEDYRPTNFTDLMGYGTQVDRPLVEDEFEGIFLTGGGGSGGTGNRVQLFQDGALVTGCREVGGSFSLISGGIENGILKLTSSDGIPTLLVINSEGQLTGAEIGRSYGRLVGDLGGAPTRCAPVEDEPPPNPVTEALDACRPAIVYGINFDVDRDEIRTRSPRWSRSWRRCRSGRTCR